jgi:pSer/pThr/pTyr-binding forkhead associated (FHA) protein
LVSAAKRILAMNGRTVFLAAALGFGLLALLALYLSLSRKNIEDGVYRIVVSSDSSWGHGTGFKVADPGFVVTNHHVIDGARRIEVAFMEGGVARSADARVLWFSSDKDLAIIRVDEKLPGRAVELAGIGADELAKTESVTAIGFPAIADRVARELERGVLNASNHDLTLFDPTVSSGTIQRLVPTIQRLTIQHSANINSGNSGGPLFDSCNRVVGVNTIGTRSTVGARDIYNALIRSGQLTINDPGDLEFAVHIREVLLGLSEKEIAVSTTPGRCRGGLDVYELTAIGSSTALALVSLVLAGVSWRRGSRAEPAPVADVETELQIADLPAVFEEAGIVLTEVVSGRRHPISGFEADLRGNGVVLGRAGGGAAIKLDAASVSRRHARIRYHGNDIVVHDEGSTNGTRVDGNSVSRTQGRLLRPGSTLYLGDAELLVESAKPAKINLGGSNRTARRWLLSGFDLRGTTIQHIFAATDDFVGHEFTVVCTIGRSPENDLVIDDESVSRRHAQIGMNGRGVLSIADLGSSNGTFVDGAPVGATPVQIQNAKVLTFGRTELTISLQS